MRDVDTLASALGPPRVLREVGRGRHALAAVGRWRHGGADVDLSAAEAVHLVFNVSGGQLVERRWPGRSDRGVARAGSVGVNLPGTATRVAISG
ncbi:MAG TPA: hypothetical protein VGD56_21445, partial [Gemmatirosa sp.]